VLKRDAEIAMLKANSALRDGGTSLPDEALAEDLEEARVLDDSDREFLRKANIGGEAMKAGRPGAGARHRHRLPLARRRRPDRKGFPERRRAENLNIRAGTLTQKEREIINYHIVATIKMLEQLPWPKHLKNVPEYAGGHHERMDGKGYPKGLSARDVACRHG
jgi:hypothetical protein